MLYLMRKLGESIIINGNIEVQVVEVRGKNVRLGFNFPETATVLRKEVHDRIVEENRAAAMGNQLGAADMGADMGALFSSVSSKPKDPKTTE